MKRAGLFGAMCVVLALGSTAAMAAGPEVPFPWSVKAALADFSRPDADRQRDAARHPGELMVFAGVKRGQKIADFIPGGGYFTRIFAKIVGPQGRVYAVFPDFL